MTDKFDQLKNLEMLEALLEDVERALADGEILDEADKAVLQELRRQCALERKQLMKSR